MNSNSLRICAHIITIQNRRNTAVYGIIRWHAARLACDILQIEHGGYIDKKSCATQPPWAQQEEMGLHIDKGPEYYELHGKNDKLKIMNIWTQTIFGFVHIIIIWNARKTNSYGKNRWHAARRACDIPQIKHECYIDKTLTTDWRNINKKSTRGRGE